MTIQNTNTTNPSNLPNLTQELLSGHSELINEIIEKHPDIESLEHCLRAIAASGLSYLEDKIVSFDDELESNKDQAGYGAQHPMINCSCVTRRYKHDLMRSSFSNQTWRFTP